MVEENYRKNITVDDVPVTINIVDTAGQVRFSAYLVAALIS